MVEWQSVAGALVASIAVGILFDVRRQHLIYGGLIAGLGWGIYLALNNYTNSSVLASFIAASLVAYLSETVSRIKRVPILIPIVPGIIPLLPGKGAYETMVQFANGEYLQGMATGTQTLFIAGGIAAGMVLVSTFFRLTKLGRKKRGG